MQPLLVYVQLRSGFTRAILGTLRVRVDGLLTLGPPCGSFVYLNRATSGRSRDRPLGYEDRPYVEMASLCFVLQSLKFCSVNIDLLAANLIKHA